MWKKNKFQHCKKCSTKASTVLFLPHHKFFFCIKFATFSFPFVIPFAIHCHYDFSPKSKIIYRSSNVINSILMHIYVPRNNVLYLLLLLLAHFDLPFYAKMCHCSFFHSFSIYWWARKMGGNGTFQEKIGWIF